MRKAYASIVYSGVLLLIVTLSSSPLLAAECSPLQVSVWSPVQLVPVEKTVCGIRLDLLYGDNEGVEGIDIGLVNGADSLKGIQIGVLNWASEKDSWGIQIGLLVNSRPQVVHYASFTGIQIAGFGNRSGAMKGLQLGLFGNMIGNKNDHSASWGIQAGGINNIINSEFTGLQLGMFNELRNVAQFNGVQIGGFNNYFPRWKEIAGTNINGLQIAVVGNVANNITGVQMAPFFNASSGYVKGGQIGIVNVCKYLNGFQVGVVNIVYGGVDAYRFFPVINIGWH